MRKFFISFAFTIVAITALMLIPSKQKPAPMPWEVTIMPDGKTQVFGIHLGTTTYRKAQKFLRSYGKMGIFTQEGKPPSVEVFFNSINLGGLSAKLVLNLAVDEQSINLMLSRAIEARLQPSGARRYDLNNEDNATLIDATITAITYIPSVQLTPDMIQHRFGKVDKISHDITHGNEIWHYFAIDLTVHFKDGKNAVLYYQ